DVGALARKGDRHRPADAGIGAGDQSRAALELAAAAIGTLAVIGSRIHLAGLSRRLLLLRFERRFGAGFFRIVVAHRPRHIRMLWNPNGAPESPVPERFE